MSIIAKDTANVSRSVQCDEFGRLVVIIGGGGTGGGAVTVTPAITTISQNSITTIAGSSQVTLLTYTNSSGAVALMNGFIVTGTVDAEYEMQINTIKTLVVRSSETQRNVQVFLPFGLRIENTNIVTLKVTHYETFTASFDCSLFLYKW